MNEHQSQIDQARARASMVAGQTRQGADGTFARLRVFLAAALSLGLIGIYFAADALLVAGKGWTLVPIVVGLAAPFAAIISLSRRSGLVRSKK